MNWEIVAWAVLIIIPSAIVYGIGNAVFGNAETLEEKRARKKKEKEKKMEGGDER